MPFIHFTLLTNTDDACAALIPNACSADRRFKAQGDFKLSLDGQADGHLTWHKGRKLIKRIDHPISDQYPLIYVTANT
jgi:hypothetical protein